jgi:predicted ribosome quality control (RQC) complex YloA/Tae2 family protein
MSFDGNIVRKLTKEFNDQLNTGRINKIYQLSKYDLLFNINSHQGKSQLYISCSPSYSRINISTLVYEKPSNPPTFCMFLRKHLEGGIIEEIKQVENDRIIEFRINKRNELGDKQDKYFIVEVMGRHSNLIITDDSYKILESIKHTMPFDNADRTIYPGAIYKYPSSDKINPYDIEKRTEFLSNIDNINQLTIQNSFQGFSPLIAKEIMYRFETDKQEINTIFQTILNEDNPSLYFGNKDIFYYTNLHNNQSEYKTYTSVSELIDRYYLDRDKIDIIKQRSKDIIKFINNSISRLKSKIEKLRKEIKKADKRESTRRKGEFIQNNLHLLSKGDNSFTCLDYYDNQEITISLDPLLNPIQNSEKYFKKYKKLKASIPHINIQINEAKLELDYFVELLHQVENASLKDIEEIKNELEDKKYIKNHSKQKRKNNKPNYLTFVLNNGIEVLVGKNNVQNEHITHKLAKHNEVWFHVKDAPGSHVLVRKQFPLDEETIRSAANIAAYFSKLRKSGTVPVDYLEKRYIKKIPGKINSFVTYTNNKTIYIDPDEDFILSLNKK